MGASLAQGLPGISERKFLADALAAGFERKARHAKPHDRLHRGNYAQFLEALDIGRIDHFDMLDAMPRIARAIGLACRLEAVERAPDRAIANGMHADLEPVPVGAD